MSFRRARGSRALVVLVAAVLGGCRDGGGVAAVTRAIAGRYGERAFELEVRSVAGGGRTVVVTLRDARTGEPARTAAEIAGLVRREFPLTGDRDSVHVRLSAEAERGPFRTRRVTTYRFGAGEPP